MKVLRALYITNVAGGFHRRSVVTNFPLAITHNTEIIKQVVWLKHITKVTGSYLGNTFT